MRTPTFSPAGILDSRWLLPAALVAAVAAGWLASQLGLLLAGGLVLLPLLALGLGLVFRQPRTGLVFLLVYCFLIPVLGRYDVPQPGLVIDGLLVLTWAAAVLQPRGRLDWGRLRSDLVLLTAGWFVITVLELLNPADASKMGWLLEMRATALYWALAVPLAGVLLYRAQDVRLFIGLVIGLSVLGALYGIKQKVLGVSAAEQAWLDGGGAVTHLIWGRLRVFSFYNEAAQFGASQAHVGLMCLILALGPFATWKRLLLAGASGLCFYGMLISGTRGAFFVVVSGLFLYLVMSRQTKILVVGCGLAVGAILLLKYTSVGSSNADIMRLRTALDPADPSLQLRLQNQAKLRAYLADRPLGGGLGSIGIWGGEYNQGTYLASIPPDSYFVKVWAEYGIVGFVIWFSIMLYILGKCCGIVWRLRQPQLRQQLLALTAGFGGILVSSYGNEVMNQVPSSIILYLSWAVIFRGPALDAQLAEQPPRPPGGRPLPGRA